VYGESLRAPVVVAADGRRSALVRSLHARLGDPMRSSPSSWFGIKAHLHGDPARLGTRVELHLFDGGYAGIGTVENGLLNLCVMVTVRALRASGGSPERLLRQGIVANPAAREILEGVRPVGPWKSVGPLRFGARRAAAGGVFFVGDAAGTIDPFSGEGMGNALRSAEIALPFVLAAVERGGATASLARGYRGEWRRAFAGVIRRVRLLGFVLERPSLAAPALAVLSRFGGPFLPALVSATRTGLGRSSPSPGAR
jgi:flavin-dependent dehydrogenase